MILGAPESPTSTSCVAKHLDSRFEGFSNVHPDKAAVLKLDQLSGLNLNRKFYETARLPDLCDTSASH